MKIKVLGFSLLVCIFSLILITKSSPPPSSLLGIPLQDEDYFKTEIIKCKNGSKKFTKAQLNDDFCDCPDGTDEPGTSACPQGKFHCRNAGHLPTSLPSSRVNDGICDCCDGSDEYDGKVKCPNTCWEAGKVARNKLLKKINTYKEGVTLRKKEIEQAKLAAAKDEEELSKLKNEETALKKLIKQLKVHKEQIEKAEEKERLEKEKEEKMEKPAVDKDIIEDESNDDQRESSNSGDDKTGPSDELSADKHEKDDDENMEGLPNETENTEELSQEELGRLVASRWTGGKTRSKADAVGSENNHGGSSETSERINDDVYDNDNSMELSIKSDVDHSKSIYMSHIEEQKDLSGKTTFSSSSWLEKIKDAVQSIFKIINASPPLDKLDADRVRKEYDDATTRLSDVESRISSLTEKLKHDFGGEKEFYTLYGQCYETKQDKYVYKVCPFKEATQEEGYHHTRLGEWERFENSYHIMQFSNGQGCWNGPDRSLKVKLKCGLKTELADVDELSRCEYTALMTTPALCLEGKLEEFKHKLEAMQKEQTDGHDEL